MSGYEDGSRGQRIQAAQSDYLDVADRVRQFRSAYPSGSLQPRDPENPIRIVEMKMPTWAQGTKVEETQTYLEYVALAYRTPDDPRPGIGIAWERFPGITPYTRHSEAMNAETSAWGRAIVAALAGDTRVIASQQEVFNREQDTQGPTEPDLSKMDEALAMLTAATDKPTMVTAWNFAGMNRLFDVEVPGEGLKYRDLWKRHLDIVTGLGQGTESPAPVAPPEEKAAQETAEAVVADVLDGEKVADGPAPE